MSVQSAPLQAAMMAYSCAGVSRVTIRWQFARASRAGHLARAAAIARTTAAPGRHGIWLLAVRLVIARCSVDYAGRLSAHLPLATRLIMVKADGSVLVHSDGGA